MKSLRTLNLCLAGCLTFTSLGCGLWHELQPHRLHRWNRGPDMGAEGYNFSIADPSRPTVDLSAEDQPAKRAESKHVTRKSAASCSSNPCAE